MKDDRTHLSCRVEMHTAAHRLCSFQKFCVHVCDGSRSYVALWNWTNKLIKSPGRLYPGVCWSWQARANMCGAGCYLCGGRLTPTGFHLKHIAPSLKVALGLLNVWINSVLVCYLPLWVLFHGWTEVDRGLPCHAEVGWADSVGACDWERCHSTCGHSLLMNSSAGMNNVDGGPQWWLV